MIVDQKINQKFIGVFLIDGNLDGTKLAVTRKPNKVQRILIRLIFGWKWASIEKVKSVK